MQENDGAAKQSASYNHRKGQWLQVRGGDERAHTKRCSHAHTRRSTRNAGTAVRYLSNANTPAVDHRPAKATDMRPTHERKGPRANSAAAERLPDSFRYLCCPVTGLLLPRDPPAAGSMENKGCARVAGAPINADMGYQNRDADDG